MDAKVKCLREFSSVSDASGVLIRPWQVERT
jgi:hypothetical protein